MISYNEMLFLLDCASKTLDRCCERHEAAIAQDHGLIEWDIDVDGYYPTVTKRLLQLHNFHLTDLGTCPDCLGDLDEQGYCDDCHIVPSLNPEYQKMMSEEA